MFVLPICRQKLHPARKIKIVLYKRNWGVSEGRAVMHSSSVLSAFLCILLGASFASADSVNCVESLSVFCDKVVDLTSTSTGLYSFEQSCQEYMVSSRSSQNKALYLLNYTTTCQADSSQLSVTERPASLDTTTSYFSEFFIQLIFQVSIVQKTVVYQSLENVSCQ